MCFITLLEVLLIRSHEYRSGTEKQTQGGKALVVVKTSYEKQVGFWVRASLASRREYALKSDAEIQAQVRH